MKTVAIAVCVLIGLAAPSFAQSQTTQASTDQGSGGSGGSGGKGAKSGKMKEAVQACRKGARSQGLTPKSKEMRQAVMDCVVKDHPGMANIMKCRMEGMDKGMKPGEDLKAFVKDCIKNHG